MLHAMCWIHLWCICLGNIREQIDPVPLSVCSVSLLPLLESEKPREFKLDKCLNACADCPGSSAGKKENICVGSQYFKAAVQLLISSRNQNIAKLFNTILH